MSKRRRKQAQIEAFLSVLAACYDKEPIYTQRNIFTQNNEEKQDDEE